MCLIDSKTYPICLTMSGLPIAAWKISHFVKHVLIEADLKLCSVLGISLETAAYMFKTLQQEFDCSFHKQIKKNDEQTSLICARCFSLKECEQKLAGSLEHYTEYLKNIVRNDHKKPRHIYYDLQDTKSNLAFVDDKGVIVVTRIQRPGRPAKLELKSGYRPFNDPANINALIQKLKELYPDRYYLARAKDVIRRRVKRGKYLRAKMILEKNW
ncbi:MAG: hypothetical protein WCQ99_03135 [Pseudomonadota bacterium]